MYASYANYFMCRYQTTISVYMPHMNSMQSAVWPRTWLYIHFILLAYPSTNMPATSHMYVPLHKYCSLHVDPTLLYTLVKNINKLTFIYHNMAMYVLATNMHLKCHRYAQYANYINFMWEKYFSIYTSNELSVINNVMRSSDIPTFHITDICPWTNLLFIKIQ